MEYDNKNKTNSEEDLKDKKCTVCAQGSPPLTEGEIQSYLPHVPSWKLIESSGVNKLRRKFKFDNFKQALSFTNKIGELAEEVGHHPSILTEWGKVKVIWYTHKIKGLHLNDFIMASKTDDIYEQYKNN